jgi:hypothetical protein
MVSFSAMPAGKSEESQRRRSEYLKRWNSDNRAKRLAQARIRNRVAYADPVKREEIKKKLKACAVVRAEAEPMKYWAKQAAKSARQRAAKSGVECSITWSDLETPAFCPVLGVQLDYRREIGRKVCSNSPSVDRIDNSRGYVPGNVAVISWRANSLKKDATAAELRAVLAYVEAQS